MSFIDVILGCAIALFLLAPGIITVFALFPGRSFVELFFVGGAVGWAIFTLVARLFPLNWWFVVLIPLYAVAGALLMYRSTRKTESEKTLRSTGGWILLLLGSLSFARQLLPVTSGDLPPGEPPMFHLILTAKTILTGRAPTDWQPFAAIPVNYALGTHIWTAWISKLSSMQAHFAFRISFLVPAFFIAGLIYMVAMEIFDNDKRSSFFASLLWITASLWGGQQLFMMGQLPQAVGIFLTLALFWFMLAETGVKSQILMGILAAGIFVNHQNTLLAVVCVTVLTATVEKVVYGRVGSWGWKLILAVVIGLALTPLSAIRGIELLLNPKVTDLYKFREFFIPAHTLFSLPGVLISFTGSLGIAIILARAMTTEKRVFLMIWVASLMTALALFGYFYRMLAFGYVNNFYVVFTPSGLAISLTAPLCLAGGWFFGNKEGFYRFRAISAAIGMGLYLVLFFLLIVVNDGKGFLAFFNHVKLPFIFMCLTAAMWLAGEAGRTLTYKIAAATVSVMLVIYAVFGIMTQTRDAGNIMGIQNYTDLRKLRGYISEDSLVLNSPAEHDSTIYGWLPYWLWNECSYVVMPSTEWRSCPELLFKSFVLQRDVYEAQIQSGLKARSIALLTPPEADYTSLGCKIVYSSKNRRVQIYEP